MARRPVIIVTANQKGGVGKSSVTVNLAAAMAVHLKLETLVVDLDGQCNATQALTAAPSSLPGSAYDVLWDGAPVMDVMGSVHHPRLRLVGGSEQLWLGTQQLGSGPHELLVANLRELLRDGYPEDLDVVLIDTGPSDGLLLRVALAAADYALLVAKPDSFSASAMGRISRTISEIREQSNPDLRLAGLVINEARARTRLHTEMMDALDDVLQEAVLSPRIPQAIVIGDAQQAATPVELYEDRSSHNLESIREIYRDLAREIGVRTGLVSRTKPRGQTRTPASGDAA